MYVSGVSGNNDIYLQSLTGQTPINLTKNSAASETSPAFSPDGELIAFRSERDGGGLFVMGRTGDSVRRLTRAGYQPAWFPDGRRLVYASIIAAQAEARGPGISELWAVPVSGGEPQRLHTGDAVQPRVSPNGRRVAFWAMPADLATSNFTSANRDVWTMAVDGSGAVRVTTDEATDWNPVWSADGQWLYYLSNRGGSMNLWRVAIDEATGVTSSQPQALTAPAAYVRHIGLAADGRVGTYATLSVSNNLARMAFDPASGRVTGPLESLTTGPREFQDLDVSPDGRTVVLQTAYRLQEDLILAGEGAFGLRNLTNDRQRDRGPRWTPDGRRILFYSDRDGGNYELWSIDTDGGNLRRLSNTGGRGYFPIPSPDGRRFVAADISAWTLGLFETGGAPTPVEVLPALPEGLRAGSFNPSAWSLDGTQLAGSTSASVWVYAFATRRYREVASFGTQSATGTSPHWLPDGRRLLYARQGRLVLTDTVSGESQAVLAIPGEQVSNPRLSPDGKFLYFLHGSASGDVWTIRFDRGDTAASPGR